MAAAALLAALVGGWVIGASPNRELDLVVAPLTSPASPETAAASQTPTPTASARATPAPPRGTPLPETFVLTDWGVSVQRDPSAPWTDAEIGFDGLSIGLDSVGDPAPYVFAPVDQTAVDLYFGPCAGGSCGRPIITVSVARNGAGVVVGTTTCEHAPPGFYFDCVASNDSWPMTASGDSLAQLRKSWIDWYGDWPTSKATIDGAAAVTIDRGGLKTLLAIRNGVPLAVITQPLMGSDPGAAALIFERVVAGVRFLPNEQTGLAAR